MNQQFSMIPIQMQMANTLKELEACNDISEQFGLCLTTDQMIRLAKTRFRALENAGRVEFGEGILKKLIYRFCDSPYLMQNNYEDSLSELQEIFYYFKNESMEKLSDDELIDAMKNVFDGKAQGSIEYLSGTSLENLCRIIRGGAIEEEIEIDEEDYES